MTYINPKHIKVIRSTREYNKVEAEQESIVIIQMDNNDLYRVVFPEEGDADKAKESVKTLINALLNYDLNRPLVKISDA